MNIKRFNESKKDEVVVEFDIKSFEDDKKVVGFARDTEETTKNEQDKIKKAIQNDGGTPGLKTAIKKFEDFSVKIIIDEEGDDSSLVPVGVDVNQGECCANCECDPCECEVDNTEYKEGCGCCDECTGQSDCECCEQCSCVQMGELPMEQPKVMNITDFISSIIGQR